MKEIREVKCIANLLTITEQTTYRSSDKRKLKQRGT